MMRRVLLCSAAALFLAAGACAVVAFVGILRFIFATPGVEEGMRQVVEVRRWVLAFFGCAVAGSVILWFVRDPDKGAAAGPGAAPKRGDT
jgi:hypothetical protein